jgi:uncharacterized protein (DUF2267 family)
MPRWKVVSPQESQGRRDVGAYYERYGWKVVDTETGFVHSSGSATDARETAQALNYVAENPVLPVIPFTLSAEEAVLVEAALGREIAALHADGPEEARVLSEAKRRLAKSMETALEGAGR